MLLKEEPEGKMFERIPLQKLHKTFLHITISEHFDFFFHFYK